MVTNIHILIMFIYICRYIQFAFKLLSKIYTSRYTCDGDSFAALQIHVRFMSPWIVFWLKGLLPIRMQIFFFSNTSIENASIFKKGLQFPKCIHICIYMLTVMCMFIYICMCICASKYKHATVLLWLIWWTAMSHITYRRAKNLKRVDAGVDTPCRLLCWTQTGGHEKVQTNAAIDIRLGLFLYKMHRCSNEVSES